MYYRVPLQTKNMANIIKFCMGEGKIRVTILGTTPIVVERRMCYAA